jgi:hypothetical protein
MASSSGPLKLYQIEEPDGAGDAGDGIGLAVGIELSRARGAMVAASVGGNAETVVPSEGALTIALTVEAMAGLLRELRSAAEKTMARPVTHAVIRIDGLALSDAVMLPAAAAAGLAVMGIRRDGDGSLLDTAIEAEELVALLSG